MSWRSQICLKVVLKWWCTMAEAVTNTHQHKRYASKLAYKLPSTIFNKDWPWVQFHGNPGVFYRGLPQSQVARFFHPRPWKQPSWFGVISHTKNPSNKKPWNPWKSDMFWGFVWHGCVFGDSSLHSEKSNQLWKWTVKPWNIYTPRRLKIWYPKMTP